MLLALNGATTMKASLETDIRAAGDAGFDLIEIWAAKLRKYLKQQTVQHLIELLDAHRLQAYSINSIEHITFRSPARHAELLAECEELCRIARAINCAYIVVVPSPRPQGASEEEILTESARILRELSDLAEQYEIRLAFEFLGFPDCSVRTLAMAREIIDRVARLNVGLVIDSFHFYIGGSTLESIKQLDPDQVFIFHVNDAEDRPRLELRDHHRLMPGLGILPLKELWSGLRAIGYDRVASVEIFRPEYWDRDPFQLAVEAKEAVKRALAL